MAESSRKTSQKKMMPRSHSRASTAPASPSVTSPSGSTTAPEPSTSKRRKNDTFSNNSSSSNGVSNSSSSSSRTSSSTPNSCRSNNSSKTKAGTPSSSRSSDKLYALLGVSKTATSAEIAKAYRALALLLHPDKVLHRLQQQQEEEERGSANARTKSVEEMRQEATRHFQELQNAYSILKDPARRKLYDDTGFTGEDGEEPQSFEEAYAFYRTLFPEIDMCAIEKFKETYLGSEAEKDDIREFCEKFNGDLSRFFEYIPFSEKNHVPRYVKILEEMREKKELPQAKQPTKKAIDLLEQQAKKLEKLTAREAAQAEKHKNWSTGEKSSGKRKKADVDGLEALALAIQTNANKRARNGNSFLDQLAQKYGEGQRTAGGRKNCSK